MSLADFWNDFTKNNHPFIVGLVAVIIISLILLVFYYLINFIANVLPPIHPLVFVLIVGTIFVIYKFGKWLKRH